MLLQSCALGVAMSWDDGFPGARASRPHKAWHSFGHLPHLDQPGTAPWLSFGPADAVPADRVGCLQHRTEAQRQPKGQGAGGTPALPGNAVPAARAVEADSSRFVALRDPSCNFVDNSFFCGPLWIVSRHWCEMRFIQAGREIPAGPPPCGQPPARPRPPGDAPPTAGLAASPQGTAPPEASPWDTPYRSTAG